MLHVSPRSGPVRLPASGHPYGSHVNYSMPVLYTRRVRRGGEKFYKSGPEASGRGAPGERCCLWLNARDRSAPVLAFDVPVAIGHVGPQDKIPVAGDGGDQVEAAVTESGAGAVAQAGSDGGGFAAGLTRQAIVRGGAVRAGSPLHRGAEAPRFADEDAGLVLRILLLREQCFGAGRVRRAEDVGCQ